MKKISKKNLSRWAASLAVFAVAVAPIGASAAASSTTVSTTVNSYIDVSSGSTTALGSVVPGGSAVTATNTVTVNSNDLDGYTLSIKSTDASSTLDGPSSNTIAASAGTKSAPVALANDTWGYNVTGMTASMYAGVTSSAVEIKSTTGVADADATTITYATKVSTTKAAGAYSDSVTYTALAK
jgi:hypothetical protein